MSPTMRPELAVGVDRAPAQMEQRMKLATTWILVKRLHALVVHQERHVTRETDPGLDAKWFAL